MTDTSSLLDSVLDARHRLAKPFERLAKNLKGYRRTERVGYPVSLFNIELTNECPLRCVMCPRTNNMTRPLGNMEFGLFKKAIDELIEVNPGFVRLKKELWLHHFGESLVHPEIGRFIRYAVGRGINTGLSINPIMLKEKLARELIGSEPGILVISLDGHDDDSFEAIRGLPNAYEKSKENLIRFLEMKKRHGSATKIVFQMIDFSLNAESIAKARTFWESLDGIDEFLHKGFTTWDGSAADVNALVGKTPGDHPPAEGRRVQCSFPWNTLTITWDGDVVPCCHDYDKKLVLGNIREQTLSEIWNGEKLRQLRREFLSNRVTNPLCRDCDMLYG